MINIRDKKFIKLFGQNLRKLRSVKSLTQEDLAYSADIPISQIGRIERGEINTTISTINALANALNIEPKELLNFPSK
jgi:transcriptional regulator with XRE-family HTH domain